ncbi:hypothetical protein ACEPAH_3069 [Sanghuangporus vaninii]
MKKANRTLGESSSVYPAARKKKGGRKDQNENVSKLMFNIQQTMTLDPCRRFTFGITIENTNMRLWFCSRATPIVSEAFDFTTAIKPLTHIFLSLMEVAQVLYKVRKLSDVFTVLIDGAKVLRWIHGCGWVHRDISPGNLYLYEGRDLVGDLEYAKQKNLDAVDERRIGTPDFMAAEAVALGRRKAKEP